MNPEEIPLPPDLIDSGILRSSIQLDKLYEALSLAQGELHDPAKNKVASVQMKSGGKYSYKYSDLADLLKIVRPVFAKHGLCLIQFPMNPKRGSVMIITRIGHKSGQWIEGDLTMLVEDDRPQTLGSAITYGRRYSASGASGLAPDEDEDGNLAHGNEAQTGSAPQKPQKTAQSKPQPKQEPKGQPAQGEDGYDPQNRQHQDWLIGKLKKRNVPEERWDDVGNAMKGKESGELERILQEVLL